MARRISRGPRAVRLARAGAALCAVLLAVMAPSALADTGDGNQPPDAVDDTLVVTAPNSDVVDVIANDSDPDGDPLTVSDWSDAAHGSVDCFSSGPCTYFPDPFYEGPDSFTYTVSDGRGGTDTATVGVTVEGVGSLEIALDARPDDAQDFELEVFAPPEASYLDQSFQLDDDGDPTLPASRRIPFVRGDILVTIALRTPAGWRVAAECTDEAVIDHLLLNVPTDDALGELGPKLSAIGVSLQPDEDVRCTFTLTSIFVEIALDSEPDDGQDFPFFVRRDGELLEQFQLDDDGDDGLPASRRLGPIDPPVLAAMGGRNNVTLEPPDGWTVTSVECADPGRPQIHHDVFSPGSVTVLFFLEGGDDARCTFRVARDDTAPPTVVGVPDRQPNANGWYRAPVTIDWQSSDPAPSSGAPSDPPDAIASTEGAGVLYISDPSCDPAGNCATGSLALSIDMTAPDVAPDASSTSCTVPGTNGWCRGVQTAGFTASDATSGVSSPCTAAAGSSCGFTRQTATEGAAVTIPSGEACDAAGNCTPGIDGGPFKIDATQPNVSCQASMPAFTLGQAGAQVFALVTDTLSGPASAVVSAAADTSSVGRKSVSLTGEDTAGNAATINCGYVVTYDFQGFFDPVDNGGVLNVVKAGRAVPLKWRLTDASGAPVLDLASATISVQGLSCSAGTSEDLVEETTAGASGLQNLGDGTYQLNWKPPSSYAGSCKTLRLDLGEGIYRTALFRFTG